MVFRNSYLSAKSCNKRALLEEMAGRSLLIRHRRLIRRKDRCKHPEEAIANGKQGHADVATKHANSAVMNLEQVP